MPAGGVVSPVLDFDNNDALLDDAVFSFSASASTVVLAAFASKRITSGNFGSGIVTEVSALSVSDVTPVAISTTFFVASLLLQVDPPLYSASVLSSSRDLRLDFSITIGVVGSHVLYQSLCDVRAAFMPVTVWSVNRLLPDLSQINDSTWF